VTYALDGRCGQLYAPVGLPRFSCYTALVGAVGRFREENYGHRNTILDFQSRSVGTVSTMLSLLTAGKE